MIRFQMTQDPHSKDIFVDGQRIGSIMWHDTRPPLVVFSVNVLLNVNLDDLREITDELALCSSRDPFVTERITSGFMIRRNNPVEYLTADETWTPNMLEGITFQDRQNAERIVTQMTGNYVRIK